MTTIPFALNHMAAPRLSLGDLLALAGRLGMHGVEIRNDIAGTAIADGTAPGDVRVLAERAGTRIVSINALYPFNMWDEERAGQARRLVDYAAACGAAALVMCPLNDAAYAASDAERALLSDPAGKRSVSSARRWIDALRLSTSCELIDGCASTRRTAA